MSLASQRQDVTAQMLRMISAAVLNNVAVAARLRLGVNDVQVIGLIQNAGQITPGELARQTGLSTGSITGIADRLVEAGYAARSRDERDRRKVYLTANPAGIARISKHYEHYGAHLAAVLERRSGPQLTVIAEFLADVNSTEAFIAPAPD
jgi:DNA-binding MarR family transcriptional regulator